MPFFSFNRQQLGTVVAVALFCSNTLAGVVISNTRVLYPAEAKEVSVKVSNNGDGPVLLQSWIDSGDVKAKPSTIKVPFVLTPPINRVEPGKGQTLRISYMGSSLPVDRESIFWLNVLEVPAKSTETDKNRLQIAFRNRIKLFYRPAGLPGQANEAAKALTWNTQDGQVQATNPTPYYVSLVNLSVNGHRLPRAMVAPRSTMVLDLPGKSGNHVTGSFINDYGAVNTLDATVR